MTVHNPSIGLLRRGLQLGVVRNHRCHRFKQENVVWVNSKKISGKTLQTGYFVWFSWIIYTDIDIGVVSLRWWSSPLITFLIFVFCPLTSLIVVTLPHTHTSPYENNKPKENLFSFDFHIMRKIFNNSMIAGALCDPLPVVVRPRLPRICRHWV